MFSMDIKYHIQVLSSCTYYLSLKNTVAPIVSLLLSLEKHYLPTWRTVAQRLRLSSLLRAILYVTTINLAGSLQPNDAISIWSLLSHSSFIAIPTVVPPDVAKWKTSSLFVHPVALFDNNCPQNTFFCGQFLSHNAGATRCHRSNFRGMTAACRSAY